MEVREIQAKAIPVFMRHGVTHAALFGSRARGEATEESDFDILVEFNQEKTLFDLAALKIELEQVLGRNVDVLTYRSLHPRIKDEVLRNMVVIL